MLQTLEIRPQAEIAMGSETTVPLARGMGRGSVRMLDLDSGIRLSISDYKLNKSTMMTYGDFPAVLGFGFCLSGHISSRPEGFGADIIRAGQSAVFHLATGSMEETVGTDPVLRLNIMLAPERCQEIFGSASDQLPLSLEKLFSSPGRSFAQLTPAMHNAILQILDCPFQGLTRDLFLKGKVLELMALKLDAMDAAMPLCSQGKRLKDEDIDRTRCAAQLLTRDMENPPGVSELGRQVGICQSKLHKCFREVYGMTPFDYLRHKRLEKAERLLRHGKLNVTEAAGAVGYSSLSHFSKAFKQFTGYLPGQLARTGRGIPNSR